MSGDCRVKHDYQARLEKLRDSLAEKDIEALLITSPANRFYLSGFDGSNGYLFISHEKAILATDFRYLEQASEQAGRHMEIYPLQKKASEELAIITEREGWSHLGFEEEYLTYYNYNVLVEKLDIPFIPVQQTVEKLRMVKEEGELELIRKAAQLTDEAYAEIRPRICPGVRERDLAIELEYILQKKGGEGPTFNYIVASGVRSALPHGVASSKEIQEGELVILDFGVSCGGYSSDMTRTVFVGTPQKEHEETWQVVREAQQAALKEMQSGAKAVDVDTRAREVIKDAGMADKFGHGLGHGLGLEAHEAPTLSSRGKETLSKNMVVTVEPGVYFKDWGGIRIEDMVIVGDKGPEIITGSIRELL